MNSRNWKPETQAVHCGWTPKNGEPCQLPIIQSTAYKYSDAQSVADIFDLKADGFFYSRLANPTVAAFETKIAEMEGGVAAVGVTSGQTANMLAIMNVCPAGGHVLASAALYGGTVTLFTMTLKRMGVEVTMVPHDATADEIVAAARPNTRALFAETLTNPSVCVLNFEAYSEAAKRLGVPLIVDNTFATPYLCRPFDFGADIVTHSATKYLDGHQTSIGGVIVEKGDFNWSNGNFPEFTEPDVSYHGLVYTKDFPAAPFSTKLRVQWVRDTGAILPPLNAFLINLGMQTLHLRMDRHSSNALEMAKFLQAHPKVAWVNYPGLEDSPEHERCRKYLKAASGVLCFGAVGGKEASVRAIDSLKLASIVVHVADVRTMVLHPASMTHRQLSDEQLAAAGVPPDLIRLSVGIEDIGDIKADFEQALAKI